MSLKDKTFGNGLFKSIGHETRTLLNTITGPIEIIRMYSDDSRLIEPLKILELSAYRYEKFSLRALLIYDILSENEKLDIKPIDIIDCLKHIILELDDFLSFYRIRVNQQELGEVKFAQGNSTVVYQCLEVLLEHSLQLSSLDSVIDIRGSNNPNEFFSISIQDNGLLANKFKEISTSESLPTDLDLAFFALATYEQQNLSFEFESINGKSIVFVSTKQSLQ